MWFCNNDVINNTFGEVESEGGLIGAKIVDMEDKFIRQIRLVSPHNPTDSSVNQTVFVTTHIYALNQR